MQTSRKTAVVAGILFLIATIALQPSTAITQQLFGAPDYLSTLSAHEDQLLAAVIFALIADVASAGIAISLYPVLRRQHEGLALGAVGFRLIECVFYLVNLLGFLLLLAISQQFVKAGTPDGSYLQTLGTLVQAVQVWVNFVLAVTMFSIGALMYYVIFFQSRLIPRWLAGWGIVGAVCVLAAAIYMLLGGAPYSPPMIVLVLPIAIQEIVLAVWLIVKGFNPTAVASGTAREITASPVAA